MSLISNTILKVGFNIEEINETILIKEIPDLLEKGNRLFIDTFDCSLRRCKLVPKEILGCCKIPYDKDLVRLCIRLEPTKEVVTVICTPGTRILLGNCEYRKARKLKVSDKVIAFPEYYGVIESIDFIDTKDQELYAIDVSFGNLEKEFLRDPRNYSLGCGIFCKL